MDCGVLRAAATPDDAALQHAALVMGAEAINGATPEPLLLKVVLGPMHQVACGRQLSQGILPLPLRPAAASFSRVVCSFRAAGCNSERPATTTGATEFPLVTLMLAELPPVREHVAQTFGAFGQHLSAQWNALQPVSASAAANGIVCIFKNKCKTAREGTQEPKSREIRTAASQEKTRKKKSKHSI